MDRNFVRPTILDVYSYLLKTLFKTIESSFVLDCLQKKSALGFEVLETTGCFYIIAVSERNKTWVIGVCFT